MREADGYIFISNTFFKRLTKDGETLSKKHIVPVNYHILPLIQKHIQRNWKENRGVIFNLKLFGAIIQALLQDRGVSGGGGGGLLYDIPLPIFKPRRAGSGYYRKTTQDPHGQKEQTKLCRTLKFGDNKVNIKQDTAV